MNTERGATQVLAIAGDPPVLRQLRDEVSDREGKRLDLTPAGSLAEAERILRGRAFDIVIADLALPDSQGLPTLRRVRQIAGDAAVVVLAGTAEEALAADAIRNGAQDCLSKGHLTARGLLRAMRHALERRELESALRKANADLEHTVNQRTAELVQTNRELRAEAAACERIDGELRQALDELNLIFDNAVVGIVYVRDRLVVRANPRFCEMLGYATGEVAGHSTEMFYPSRSAFETLGKAAYPVLARGVPYTTEIQFRRSDGRIFWAQLHGRAVLSEHAVGASIWVFEDIDERKRAEEERASRLARIESQFKAVGDISQSDALAAGDVERLAGEVTEAASRVTGVERANVWLFNHDETELHCIDLYEATPGRHSSGAVLKQTQFVNEFRALKAAHYVDADDPLSDPRMAGYVDTYLRPLRITSMLDAAVRFPGKHLGLLCLEHVDRTHHWEQDEITFACQLADKIALAITNRQRLQAQHSLERTNRILTVLSNCNGALVRAIDEPQLLNDICKLLANEGEYPLAWVGLNGDGDAGPLHIVAVAGSASAYAEDLQRTFNGRDFAGTAVAKAMKAGHRTALNFLAEPGLAPWRERAGRFGLKSVISLPLIHEGRTLGALAIYSGHDDPFDAEECKLLDELAGDLAYGISNLRTRAERDASLVRTRRALEDGLGALAATLEMRDPYTAGHQHRVADLATAIAREMGLDNERVRGLHLAGTVHDIGKIRVPAELLSKPSRLTPIEFEIFKTHAQGGYDILKGIELPWPIADIVLQHHERLDGSGYPNGLQGDAILLEARILTVADVVEAMASHRPYRPALGLDAALAEISGHRGARYDAAAVDACLRLFREKQYRLPD